MRNNKIIFAKYIQFKVYTCIGLKSANYFNSELIDLYFPLEKVPSQMLVSITPLHNSTKSCDLIHIHYALSHPTPRPFTHSHTQLIGKRAKWANEMPLKGICIRTKQLKLVPSGAWVKKYIGILEDDLHLEMIFTKIRKIYIHRKIETD